MRRFLNSSVLFLTSFSLRSQAAPNQTPAFDSTGYDGYDVIDRDVAIIGGGSAGTYSAISLKDKGKSVVIIEKKARLGGHTETYIDPTTGTPIDYGVVIWHNTSIVTNYFKRFDVPLIVIGSDSNPNAPPQRSANYDLRTGQPVNVSLPTPAQSGAAFAKLAAFLAQYPKLNEGMFLPNPVPEDLLLPFGEFAKKYGIEDAINTMYNYNPGLGDVLTVPTVEELRVFSQGLLAQFATGFLTTAHHNNSELYSKAQAELLTSNSLLLGSEVTQAKRGDGEKGVLLKIRTPSGKKLIRAKKLLITIPPRLEFLEPFDLTHREETVFGKLIDAGYYTAILKNTGIPNDLAITNYARDTSFNLPKLPAVYGFGPTEVAGLQHVYYGTPRSNKTYPLSDDAVKKDMIRSIKTLQKANPDKFNQTEPEFVVYSSHAPFYLQAKPEDTRKGFYENLYALQGLKNTYWTGATFKGQDSSDIWGYSETYVLPELIKGL